MSKINDIADVYRKANERGEVINYHDLDIGEGVTEVKGFDVTYYKSYSQGELCLDGHEKDVEGCPYMLLDEIHTKFILPSISALSVLRLPTSPTRIIPTKMIRLSASLLKHFSNATRQPSKIDNSPNLSLIPSRRRALKTPKNMMNREIADHLAQGNHWLPL